MVSIERGAVIVCMLVVIFLCGEDDARAFLLMALVILSGIIIPGCCLWCLRGRRMLLLLQ